jgi:hypothetical protein
MAEFEPKKRVTKNDKKAKKQVYTSKHLRIAEEIYSRHEAIRRLSRSSAATGVLKNNKQIHKLPSIKR